MTPLRLGLIGAGLVVRRFHWPALAGLADHFRVAAYTDVDDESAASFAQLTGLGAAQRMADTAALLSRDDVDAVLVAVPPAAARAITAQALAAGKHVLCEKPPGGTLEEARAFLTLERENTRAGLADPVGGLTLMMGENFFYRSDLRAARDLLQRGAIGRLRVADFAFVRRTSEAPGEFASAAWRRRPTHRGGILLDVGVHHVAQLRLLCGEPVAVQARLGAATESERETYPSLLAQLRFADGAIASYRALYNATTETPGARMSLYGDAGTLLLEDGVVCLLGGDGTRRELKAEDDGGFRAEWLDFHRAIHGRTPPTGTVAQSFRNALVMFRAFDAAASGATVEIESEGTTEHSRSESAGR